MICKHHVKSEWAKPETSKALTYALLLASRVSASQERAFLLSACLGWFLAYSRNG